MVTPAHKPSIYQTNIRLHVNRSPQVMFMRLRQRVFRNPSPNHWCRITLMILHCRSRKMPWPGETKRPFEINRNDVTRNLMINQLFVGKFFINTFPSSSHDVINDKQTQNALHIYKKVHSFLPRHMILDNIYPQTSNISPTLVSNNFVDHSATSLFSTQRLASMDDKHFSLVRFGAAYIRRLVVHCPL